MKHSISYVLETKNNRPDEVRVRMRVRWDKKLSQHLIPYTVNPQKWSKETNRCKANTTHGKDKVSANEINSEIQKYEDAVSELLKSNLTLDEFKIQFNFAIGKVKTEKKITFFTAFDEFVNKRGVSNGWTKRTYQKHACLKKHLKNFKKDLSFDLNSDDFDKFIYYLQSKESRLIDEEEKTGLKNTTIERYISMLKWFLSWAKEKGYYSGSLDKQKIKLTEVENDIIYLTWNELMKLYEYEFKNDTYSHVRDVFCFCAFTSLRYSDVAKLKRYDIFEDHISVVTQKTNDSLKIELNDYSRAILEKYKDAPFVLPVMSNQKMNEYLKKIGKILEFNDPIKNVFFIGNKRHEKVQPKYELLTTHCARRTFVVNALHLGIPAEVIMKWTGHKDYDAMKPYIAIVDDLKKSEMSKFNKKVRHLKA